MAGMKSRSAAEDDAQAFDLPPAFTLVTLRELGDAFAHARAIAGEAGAGTLIRVRRFDLIEFAVVLEPRESLAEARLAFYACMSALADALAFHAPPERPLIFGWPDAILFDGAIIGGGRLAWPPEAGDEAVPDWLVFGAMIRASAVKAGESGAWTRGISMEEAGFAEVTGDDIVAGFARHLTLAFHEWENAGPAAGARRWLERFPADEGAQQAIDRGGDLVVERSGTRDRRDFREALVRPSWLDPENGEPWL